MFHRKAVSNEPWDSNMKKIENKIILILTGFFLLPFVCFATETFQDQITITSNKKTIIRLRSRIGSNIAAIIENDSGEILKEFTYEEILLLDDECLYGIFTTAGSDWFQNSISIITYDDTFYALRTRWGRVVVINLLTNKVLQEIPPETQGQIQNIISQKAVNLLSSKEPRERQTGAIACGQLKLEEAIPQLKQLLNDKSWYTLTKGNESREIVFYVRKAAKEALEKMGIKIEKTTIELSEKGHLRYDKKMGRYIVVE